MDISERFEERVEGKKVKDVAVSERDTQIDIILDDGEPYTTVSVSGIDLSWEIGEVIEK